MDSKKEPGGRPGTKNNGTENSIQQSNPATLHHCLDCGLYLFPARNKRPAFAPATADRYSNDVAQVRRWWRQGFRSFCTLPGLGGFLAIDLDDKVSGERFKFGTGELVTWAAAHGYSFSVFAHPVFTTSPSGGKHLWFKYAGGKFQWPSALTRNGVELKHFSAYVIAPGSPGYVLTGSLTDAPVFPAELVQAAIEDSRPKHGKWIPPDKRRKLTIPEILRYSEEASPGTQETVFRAASWAYSVGYEPSEVEPAVVAFAREHRLEHARLRSALSSARGRA